MATNPFKEIREPHLHGVWARKGDRAVEVLRIDSCNETWMVFATINDHVCKAQPDDPADRRSCLIWARRFLRGDITPDLWPTTHPIHHNAPPGR